MKNRIVQLFARNRERLQAAAARAGGRLVVNAAAKEATLYLYDAIVATEADAAWFGGVSAEALVPQIRDLDVATLHLRINSPGGDVFGGEAIAHALRQSKAKVIAYVDGIAASAATAIACAADECEMAPGGMYMIHKAWTFALGNADDLRETSALLDKVDGRLAAAYAKRTGMKAEAALELMSAETWYTGDEAVAAGFADRVAEQDAEEADAKAAAWDVSAYDKAPKAAAPDAPQQEPKAVEPPTASDDHRERQRQRVRTMTSLAAFG
jgi:ATP-dependent Clp protease protease subunit